MTNQATGATMDHAATHSTSVSNLLQLATACLLGMVILYGAGFLQTSAVHNAAHDVRHSQGFPCH